MITPFLLPNPAKIGVLILPGGGYGALAIDHEGQEIGAWLNARGYEAWMLEYSVASERNPPPIYPAPHDDVSNAILQIRAQNRVEKLGVWGFSAGGHLAALAATETDSNLDFAILAYPVISMVVGTAHSGSRTNLLGHRVSEKMEALLSAEKRVSRQTPPTFLFHTANDAAVPVQNALFFAGALAAHQVPFELHIYENGPHGVGLATGDAVLSTWSARLEDWLARR